MRMKGENQGRRETQKQVLTSNKICCIDFATLALEQIRGTGTLPSRMRCSLEQGGSGGTNRQPACAHTHRLCGAHPSGAPLRWDMQPGRRERSIHHRGCRSHTIPISNKMRIPEQATELMSCPRWKAVLQLAAAAPATPTSFQQREQGGEG